MADSMLDRFEPKDSTYQHVRFQKVEGTVTLTSRQLCFRAGEATHYSIDLQDVSKHQVSPASYPKALLKVLLKTRGSATFQLPNREQLERIRKDLTFRLRAKTRGIKRPLAQKAAYGDMDPTSVAVTRASLLAANPALRQQHAYLVDETKTVSEDDFWLTHQHLVEEESAKISGMAKAGTSSLLQSHLPSSGRVTLGVEEMRQIFILYPAVHKAYEEKVPLELSDEQFWRKYLESEYFHRDRGRMGTAARDHGGAQPNANTRKGASGPTLEEQEARAAAVGTDDLFSRYDQKLKEQAPSKPQVKSGRNLPVGQFDLASTYQSERGNLLESKDYHPPNSSDDGKGARVIQKYNRHWAMVLHPEEAIAGANLQDVARASVEQVVPSDTDANAGGGTDQEMQKLVDFANSQDADHAACVGGHDEYERLTLSNVEAYYAGQLKHDQNRDKESDSDFAKRHAAFASAMASKMKKIVKETDHTQLPQSCFPPAKLGRDLLSALTNKMHKDSQTEAASLEAVNNLPDDFRSRLHAYFRRSSELLRHFFGLRKVEGGNVQKLARIVSAMETLYREMDSMRKDLPQTGSGQLMSKMCLPIMEQLDWAFKLQREGTGGGGFVAVDET